MKHVHTALVALLLVILTACGGGTPAADSATPIEVRDPWVRAMAAGGSGDAEMAEGAEGEMDHAMTGSEGENAMEEMAMGSTSAAYMTLVNNTDTPDRLVEVSTAVAEVVELHNVEMENGVMKMRPVEGIEVPAGGEVSLEPGSYHAMLIGLTQDLSEGDTVTLTLTLENAGTIELEAPVRGQ